MIPKIAHFHWTGPPLSWLRMMGIWSFIRHNPDWDVRLHRTPKHISEKNLRSYAMEGDWTYAEMLCEHGGFSWGADTIFLKPIPEAWLELKMCVCTGGKNDSIHHGSIGTEPGTPFIRKYVEMCRNLEITDDMDYQAYGTLLMRSVIKKHGALHMKSMVEMPVEAMTPIGWWQLDEFWKNEDIQLSDGVVAVTWYGGGSQSVANEPNAESSEFAIARLAREACK